MNGAATGTNAAPSRPKALRVVGENIPQELKDLNQWVVWRYELNDRSEWTKVPYQADGKDRASSTNPSTWASFDTAMERYRRGAVDGIGVVLTSENKIVGVDLDHCFNVQTREPEQWAVDIINKIQSYSEFSPSGEGVRNFVKGTLPNGETGRRKGNVEAYSSRRYLTVTGHRLKNAPTTIESRQQEINELHARVFQEKKSSKAKAAADGHARQNFDDDELLTRAFSAKNGDKLKRLFHSDTAGHPSPSEADLALCSMLGFWTQDKAQIDRLFRRSALFRDKWDRTHGAQTYGERTIERAFLNRTERYERHNNGEGPDHITEKPNEHKEESVDVNRESPEAPAEPETEEQPRLFPETAWGGLFGQWREIVAPCTEAPLENLWAAFLLAAGIIIGRNVWRESPRPLYPNFYLLLIGQTGDSRKSTVLWLACELLRHIGEDFKELSGVVSAEGVYEALAQREGTKGLVYADEFRALLSVAKRKGTQDILPKLSTLYYCPERDSIDRVKDSTVIVKPFLSVISATPQAYVEDLLGELEIAGGFLNRFLIVTGDEQPPRPIVRQPSAAAWESIAAPLREIRDRVAAKPRHMEMEPQAEEAWIEFYTQWRTERKTWHPKQAQLSARIFEHVLKISMLYSALAGEEQISIDSLCGAIALGGWMQSNTLTLFSDTGLDQLGKVERVIVAILKPKGKMFRRDLQRAVGGRGFNAELFNRALTALEKNDTVALGEFTTGAGRVRATVEYLST